MEVQYLNKPDKLSVAIFNINKVITILNTVKVNKLIGKMHLKTSTYEKTGQYYPEGKTNTAKPTLRRYKTKEKPQR